MRIWRTNLWLLFLLIYKTNAWWPFESSELAEEPKISVNEDADLDGSGLG
jgi:hypothetical protein